VSLTSAPWRLGESPGAPRKKRIGVIGSLVWDVIHGRGALSAPIEEWGGITYALSALDAALPEDWEIVPIMMVGEDVATRAREFLGTLKRMAPDASLLAVPYPAQRVELRYHSEERRTERLTGGLPAWSWLALKPLLDEAHIDALLINFLSGWELDLETTMLLRQHFPGPIHCDLHMMAWAVQPDGLRTLRPIPNIAAWCRCFDFLQMNEDELAMVAPDPLSLAATAIAAGVSCLFVTLGKRGAGLRLTARSAAAHGTLDAAARWHRSARAGPDRTGAGRAGGRGAGSDGMRRRLGGDLFLPDARG
jgi:hypothetical protein